MTITITCEDCGQRHRLERKVTEPGQIYIVCHSCELPLQAVLEGTSKQTAPVVAAPPVDLGVWSTIVDFASA